MRPVSTRLRAGLLATCTALTVLVTAGPASADSAPVTQLGGNWAPFTRCPVDDPAMLAADGRAEIVQCIASHAASGSIKLGNTEVVTGASDLQAGVVQHTGGTPTLVAPAGGALIADSADIPGGLLGLMCPSDIPVISDICRQITNGTLNRITATVESAGTPTGFDLTAGATSGRPILSIPVRIHLQNPLLGGSCYIGSAAHPIVLRPQNVSAPALGIKRFDGNGTPNTAGVMNRLSLTGASQTDTTFAVPGASGCGLAGMLDWAVNLKTGLPSAAGNNSVVLDGASTYLAGLNAPGTVVPNNGRLLSQYWHSAVQ
ncbi:hypothetical protein [Streptomyces violascens]|uniref:Secreted protein n=1 Tax=Streptomyces violascens TaxID=67381 RepID=A0ABQ3QW07_9ACTN|nr:hypothetical protein [Streptomyces violascens]GGU28387.1 hypothetical protein GCM10010289_57220 [Streptomyces violascens]GHI41472.1 hypothetical protein Sviol_58800 [Streptomyces violascens]